MATFATQTLTRQGDGLAATYNTAAAAGDKFTPGDKVFIHVKNTNAADRTITFVTTQTVSEFAVADMTAVIPATTGDRFLGPFPHSLFAGTDGLVAMTYSPAETGVTIAVLRMP